MSDKPGRSPRPPRQIFTVVITDAGSDIPIGRRLAGWLKSGLRSWKLRCVQGTAVDVDALSGRLAAAEAEVIRLRGIVAGLADRVATQSELLTCKAERGQS